MTGLVEALVIAAPYYNLALVLVVIYLFSKLFHTKAKSKTVYLKPWYYLCAATVVFIIEEIITVMRAADVVQITKHINGFFELAIISLFIYTLLLQKEHVKKKKY
jgi:hypothetical protein